MPQPNKNVEIPNLADTVVDAKAVATQRIKCAIVPMELMGDIQDVLKEAPFKLAKPVLEKLSTVPVQDVEVRVPNA